MARRRRSRTKSVNARLVVVAVLVLGLAALVINGIVSAARSSSSYEALINQSFAVQANSVIAAQTVQGRELTSLLKNAPGFSRSALQQTLSILTRSTESSASQASIAASPPPSGSVGSTFSAIVRDRAQATLLIQQSITGLLGLTGIPQTGSAHALLTSAQATDQLSQAGALLMAADVADLPLHKTLLSAPGHAVMHQSPFVTDSGLLTRSAMAQLVSLLETSASLTASHQLSLLSASLAPSPLPTSSASNTITMPPTSSLVVTVVIKNLGNVGENPVAVQATITPGQGGVPSIARGTTSVSAGGTVSLQLPQLTLVPGSTVTLSVALSPAPGQTTRSGLTQTYNVVVAPSSVTTTTRKP